jgi:hypothetical protein
MTTMPTMPAMPTMPTMTAMTALAARQANGLDIGHSQTYLADRVLTTYRLSA